MLPPDELKLALDIHSRSYMFLRWLSLKIDAGELSTPHVVSSRHSEDVTAATLDWIEPSYMAFPLEMRPPADKLREFAAFFGTYLTSSFDVAIAPGVILRNQNGGTCYCSICARLVSGSHLKTKKLTSSDKKRAFSLMQNRLIELAHEQDLKLTTKDTEALFAVPEHRIAAAYSTYGYWLIQRMKGITDGPSILALWRQFAWTDAGSPRKGFKLQFDDFKKSEDVLLSSMFELAAKM
jgi:hypothetical protein